jgi:GNAT superfamily N-acetyltransferase
MQPNNPHIRTMLPADLSFAADCTAAEGWFGEDLTVWEAFYRYDPKGCFIAERRGVQMGICVATSYGRDGFIGELIVRPEWRGKGLGARLLNRAVSYLQAKGARSIYLDGVLKAIPLYERNGFRRLCRSLRFSITLSGRAYSPPPAFPGGVGAMQACDLEAVCSLDRQVFGADRGFFLERGLALFPNLCLVLVEGGQLLGYIFGRQVAGRYSAGPWVVRTGVSQPEHLLEGLALATGGATIHLGVLESNQFAVRHLSARGFHPKKDNPWRMLLGESGNLGASPQCYAIGSAAKG